MYEEDKFLSPHRLRRDRQRDLAEQNRWCRRIDWSNSCGLSRAEFDSYNHAALLCKIVGQALRAGIKEHEAIGDYVVKRLYGKATKLG